MHRIVLASGNVIGNQGLNMQRVPNLVGSQPIERNSRLIGITLTTFAILAFGLPRSSFGGLMLPIVPGDIGGPADFSTGQIETVVDADGVGEVWVTFSPLQVDVPDDSTPFTSSVTLAWNVPVSSVFVSEQVAGSSVGRSTVVDCVMAGCLAFQSPEPLVAVGGPFSAYHVTVSNLAPGDTLTIEYQGAGGEVVPEPSTFALTGLGLFGLHRYAGRRRHSRI